MRQNKLLAVGFDVPGSQHAAKRLCRKLETHHLNLCCRDSELGHADSDPGFRDSESVFFDSASEIIDLRLNYSFLCER